MFLTILSVIGKILLVILCIIIVLIALLLFAPFVYRANVVKEDAFYAKGDVRWLFKVIQAVFSFDGSELFWDVKIFGFSIKGLLTGEKKPKKKKKKVKKKKAKKQPTIMPGEKAPKAVTKQADRAAEIEVKIQKGEMTNPKGPIYEDEGEFPSVIDKISFKLRSLHDKIVSGGLWYDAYRAVKKSLFKLLRHVLPRKIKGYVRFGFDDPSLTGKTLALICMFYPIIPEKLSIEPCFDETVFKCNVNAKGCIFMIVVLVQGLKIYFNEKVKAAMGRTKGGK